MMLTDHPKRRPLRALVRGALQLWQAWIVTAALLAAVYAIAPQQVGIVAYKGVFITLGGILGFWLDCWTFDPARTIGEQWRRAGLMAAAMLAFGLGA
jgi:hypothetical protein